MQGEHHVAQNSTTTTLPLRRPHSADAPAGALSKCSTDKGGGLVADDREVAAERKLRVPTGPRSLGSLLGAVYPCPRKT